MAMVVPVYEREQAGVYYNTAAVIDADGTYLGKYRKNHIPHTSGLLGEVLLQARQPRLSRLPDALREGRRLHLLRPPLPRGRAPARPERRRDRLQPVGDGRRPLAVPLEARAAGARGRQRLLRGGEQPRRHRGAVEHRQVLRHRRYFVDPRGNFLAHRRARTRTSSSSPTMRPRHDRRGAPRLAVLPRPPARDVRATGGAAADERRSSSRTARVVTATDTTAATCSIEGEKIAAIGDGARHGAAPTATIDATGKYVLPGGIDVHTHLDMPFGGTTSADDFETGTIAAAHGGTTSIVDFAIQYEGQTLRAGAATRGTKKAEGKAAIDYGFHMIITDVNDAGRAEMDALVARGRHLLQAVHGLSAASSCSTTRASSARCCATGENGGTICMHAENGGVIDVLVQQALAEGPDRAEVPRAHAAAARRGRGDAPRDLRSPRWPACRSTSCTSRPPRRSSRSTEARDRGLPAYAETCPQYLFLSYDELRGARLRGREVRDEPAAARRRQRRSSSGAACACNDLQVVSTDHCPFCMKEQKELGQDDFSKIPNGMPGIETRMSLVCDGGVRDGPHLAQPLRRAHVDVAGEDLRPLPDARARSRPAPTPTSSSSIPNKKITLSAKTLHMRVDYNPYEGREVTGRGRDRALARRVVVENGKFVGKAGAGSFLKRSQIHDRSGRGRSSSAQKEHAMSTTKTTAPTSDLDADRPREAQGVPLPGHDPVLQGADRPDRGQGAARSGTSTATSTSTSSAAS